MSDCSYIIEETDMARREAVWEGVEDSAYAEGVSAHAEGGSAHAAADAVMGSAYAGAGPAYAGAEEDCDGTAEGCCREPVAMLGEALAGALAETFKVLSDPTRVRIISALAVRPLCVHELADALAVTQSAVSHQLAMLREMHLVTFAKDGRRVIYTLDDEHVRDLFEQGLAHIEHGGAEVGDGDEDL